ncbi:hypothetical protein MKY87_23955 [Paenibacillus sp. FSL R7-0198]|uniref:DUF6979 family protein n=1 Tax=Paenibacillus sp. FSL R7-0198 TaxID=2921674 RepID=UPI0030F52CE5
MSQNKYVQAAINAVDYVQNKKFVNPVEAWNFATGDLFGEGSWGQRKGCPRTAFLGLCEDGYVRGIPQGRYNHKENSLNKRYAIDTVKLFHEDSSMVHVDSKKLWTVVTEGKVIKSNYQVDIVKGLWGKGMILAERR